MAQIVSLRRSPLNQGASPGFEKFGPKPKFGIHCRA